MISDIFYRVLHSPPHIREWRQHIYNSLSHMNEIPDKWIDIWTRSLSTNVSDYPCDCSIPGKERIYTIASIEYFIQTAGVNSDFYNWTDEMRKSIRLDGVNCFRIQNDAYNYSEDIPYPLILFVVFEGEYVCKIPESNPRSSACLARVINVLYELDKESFLRKYIVK
jgi:hypothetical protein